MSGGAKLFIAVGAAMAALAVALGAFGAHALNARLPADVLEVYHTAVQYHFLHALGLLAVGLALQLSPEATWLRAAGWLLTAGIVLFCGSLYLLALTGSKLLGAVTPLGGVAFILGWLAVVVGALRA
ncbi:MAG TPA: DUF423 domain-containing protein [Burkholderiales bacterium]|nr:DUF423 domain-containing protein [Burkholderiales bacterium]